MHTTEKAGQSRLAYTIDGLAESTGIGRTTIFEAIKAQELHTVTPEVNGRPLRRRLILPDEAARWLNSFPDSREV
jgi:hypothetical protein